MAMLVSMVAAFAVVALTHVPWFNRTFGTYPLGGSDLLVVLAIGVATLLLAEVEKPARRKILSSLAEA